MPAHLFEGDDEAYFTWIKQNPESFVANTRRNISANYFVIHLPSCRHIDGQGEHTPGAFTERGYVKVVANSIAELRAFAAKNKVHEQGISFCGSCSPMTRNYQDERVRRSFLDPELRRRSLALASGKPEFRIVERREFVRSEHVIAERLSIAAGHCESCDQEAPFLRRTNGLPYLEVHHKKPLSEGGLDTVENTIALCPNCHRREHHGEARHPA